MQMSTPLPFPESQEEVPQCLNVARRRVNLMRAYMEAAQAHVRAIQKVCTHPSEQQYTSKDYSGSSSTECRVCGYDR